ALDEGARPHLAAVVRNESRNELHPDARNVGGRLLDQPATRFVVDQWGLGGVDPDRDDDFVRQVASPADDVQVPVGHGIEGSGANSYACTHASNVPVLPRFGTRCLTHVLPKDDSPDAPAL